MIPLQFFATAFCAAMVVAALLVWFLNDRIRIAEERIIAALERHQQAWTVGQAEANSRLGSVQEEESNQKQLLASIDRRVAATDAAIRLLPTAIDSLRSTVTTSFQELQENVLPPEAKEIGKGALTRVQGMRERMRAEEEASLKKFNEAIDGGALIAPVRVRPGD